jgi:dihydrofolate reductase
MRKLILSMMVSLDGAIARADGDLGWFRSDAEFEDEMLGLLDSVDGMLFGRVSYEQLAQYWPTAGEGGDPAGESAPGGFSSRERERLFAERMNRIPKLVVSTTLERADWGPAQILGEDLERELRVLKGLPGKDLVLFAGARLAASCLDLDLVDETRLMIHPVLLGGDAIGLTEDLGAERDFRLVGLRTFPSGIVLVRHERDRSGKTA